MALDLVTWGVVSAVRGNVSAELLAALIAFGGTITTGLASMANKLVESEEKGD